MNDDVQQSIGEGHYLSILRGDDLRAINLMCQNFELRLGKKDKKSKKLKMTVMVLLLLKK